MPHSFITVKDLEPFADIPTEQCEQMIADVTAVALANAPRLAHPDLTVWKRDAVKAILRTAILRWHEQGNGGVTVTQDTAGPFSHSQTVEPRRTGMFYPSEIAQLKRLGQPENAGKAFRIPMAPNGGTRHDMACNQTFGAQCSCGADIAGTPLWGV